MRLRIHHIDCSHQSEPPGEAGMKVTEREAIKILSQEVGRIAERC